MKIVILADIHANVTALESVLYHIKSKYRPDAIISLGDCIDYGMRSNEIIERLQHLDYPLVANLKGNHEKAVIDKDLTHFSSDRGRVMSVFTLEHLSEQSLHYIANVMQEPFQELSIDGQNILLLHGDINDPYWGKLSTDNINDNRYCRYDYVFCAHTHKSFMTDVFFDVNNPAMRNQKKTTFINPGSVGQPRNQNPCAQYVYIDFATGETHFNCCKYDIEKEQALYPEQIDSFYKERLIKGI